MSKIAQSDAAALHAPRTPCKNARVFPPVYVALPPEITAIESQTVLEACSQAYSDGGCQRRQRARSRPTSAPEATETPALPAQTGNGASATAAPSARADSSAVSQPPSELELTARVRWLNETEVEVRIGLSRWKDKRWIERRLGFELHDVSVERYRTIGFALGSLAGTVAQVARIDLESMTPPAEPAPPPPPLPAEPRDNTPIQVPRPAKLEGRMSAGFHFGRGLDQPRLGGVLEAALVFPAGLLLSVGAAYSEQAPSNDDVRGQYLDVALLFGAKWAFEQVEMSALAGPNLRFVTLDYSPSGDSNRTRIPGAELALRWQFKGLAISPYLGVEAVFSSPFDLTVEGDKFAEISSVNASASLGVSFNPGR